MALPRRFLPSIASLRALEAVDRLGSATAAAEALSLTQSAVSRQLQALEEQLGVTIILRDGRRISLTPDAVLYAAEVRAALGQIAQASMKLTVNPAGGALNISILPTFGMRWLVPRLPDFARTHPEVTLNLSTRIKPFNFDVEPFDAAIHFGEADWPDTQSMRLRGEAMIAVCAPDLIAVRAPASAARLLDMPLMHIETRPDAWRAWFSAHGVDAPRVTGTIYDQFATITQAALHGLGVALLPEYLVRGDIAAGRLAIAWGGATSGPGAYHLIWPTTKAGHGALAKFRSWLVTQIGDEDLLPR
ncbi:LysR family transcriptional regulator [Roseovarius arcticus]|uniref:LysR family transcriptional regulator n=1 Tax=Roseovarius arcticus TaxID=2547404 RepID=UPI0011108BA0|nr:LysR family transcriptional regulator [Roseovarius arcticus]